MITVIMTTSGAPWMQQRLGRPSGRRERSCRRQHGPTTPRCRAAQVGPARGRAMRASCRGRWLWRWPTPLAATPGSTSRPTPLWPTLWPWPSCSRPRSTRRSMSMSSGPTRRVRGARWQSSSSMDAHNTHLQVWNWMFPVAKWNLGEAVDEVQSKGDPFKVCKSRGGVFALVCSPQHTD